MKSHPVLPRGRWLVLALGMLVSLNVYYLNYGASFDEGDIESASPLTLVMRALAVLATVLALSPFRLRLGSALLCVTLYLLSAVSLLLAAGQHGRMNDSLFANTVLQVPVLLALASTQWKLDHAHWLRLLCAVLTVQIAIDTLVWQVGGSLWLSMAFVGGVGNPSSFGLLSAIGMTFCVFHPKAGRWRWILAATLAFGAVMTKALFALLAVGFVAFVWTTLSWRRALVGLVSGIVVAISVPTLLADTGDAEETGFLVHKLSAAGALLNLVEYDVESSTSVSLRLDIHEQTLAAMADEPYRLLWGHLNGLPYWPMDSQLLTYVGSFGAVMLFVFLALHAYWTLLAYRHRKHDGGFALASMVLFGLIFTTNRILDYYPVATLYFLIVATVLRPENFKGRPAPNPAQPSVESIR